MELKITKEKVLKAAEDCSTAKAVLQVLFPEAFDNPNDRIMKDGRMFGRDIFGDPKNAGNQALIEIKGVGQYEKKGFWLNPDFDWTLIDNNTLIPKPIP